MEIYYNELLKHLDGYTVQGLFDGKRSINDIVTLQTGKKGRVFFFDQEPMIKGIDNELWNYIFQEPTIFANSELDSADKEYVKKHYPNFIDWYYFANALVSREWFSAQKNNYAGWSKNHMTLLDCNLITGFRQYRIYLIYYMFRRGYDSCSLISFNGEHDWRSDLKKFDFFDVLSKPERYLSIIPNKKISYDNWGESSDLYNNFMQSRIPLDYYSQVNYITVSETLFIENKKHLTEKVFKPIAAGKPFILFSGHECLKYLKSYGFKTFDNFWSEEYDNISDPIKRIHCIFDLMDTELNLGIHKNPDYPFKENSIEYAHELEKNKKKLEMFSDAHHTALENRKHFWSKEFYNCVFNEAIANLELAKQQLSSKNI